MFILLLFHHTTRQFDFTPIAGFRIRLQPSSMGLRLQYIRAYVHLVDPPVDLEIELD